MYAHLSEILVKKGDSVSQGDIIGKTGVSGIGKASTLKEKGTCAPHLHFEIKSQPIVQRGDMGRCNPSIFIDFKDYIQQTEEERDRQKAERNKQYKLLS